MSNRLLSPKALNGRAYFETKTLLQETFDDLKDAKDQTVADYIDALGITSLRPIVTEKNEQNIYNKTKDRIAQLRKNARYMNSFRAKASIDNIEVMVDQINGLEEIMGDDTFSALLNSNGEIQVGDDIYKYTDVGIFIVKDKNYEALNRYLEKNRIADNLLYLTDDGLRTSYVSSRYLPMIYVVSVDDGISYYPVTLPSAGGGYSGGSSTNSPPVTDPNIQMANFINSLPSCSTYTTFLQSLFGDSDMCVDQYESKRRVKSKAYNYNYYLAYNLGVKVKHQYKGWTGFWRKEDVDEIRLGVIAGTFYYDYSSYFNPAPSQNRITTIYNNNNRTIFDANTFWTPSYYPGVYSMSGFSTQGYPTIFKDDIYIEDILPFNYPVTNNVADYGLYGALQAGNGQLKHENLNKLFWNETIKRVGNFWQSLGKSKPDNNITYSYNAAPLGKLMVAKTFYNHQYGTSDVHKTFDWGFQIGFTINSNGGINPSASPGALKKPQEFKTLMYGIVKRNGQWHGSKIATANY
ncbi:hypothetical protein [Pedobacter sp. AJM]|uniref:hypothetical protein n=1 Tax=Pedobacter sp. AJM TaxID=2003629 RepID=UPI000B4C0EAC|nr:hypothetical protein [Pedobacter sp. AJM]OWK70684.1 hypothetical protein CBW18_06160 [Pedobacter sp. AJM]